MHKFPYYFIYLNVLIAPMYAIAYHWIRNAAMHVVINYTYLATPKILTYTFVHTYNYNYTLKC